MNDPVATIEALLAKVDDPATTEEEQRTSAVLVARLAKKHGLRLSRGTARDPIREMAFARVLREKEAQIANLSAILTERNAEIEHLKSRDVWETRKPSQRKPKRPID